MTTTTGTVSSSFICRLDVSDTEPLAFSRLFHQQSRSKPVVLFVDTQCCGKMWVKNFSYFQIDHALNFFPPPWIEPKEWPNGLAGSITFDHVIRGPFINYIDRILRIIVPLPLRWKVYYIRFFSIVDNNECPLSYTLGKMTIETSKTPDSTLATHFHLGHYSRFCLLGLLIEKPDRNHGLSTWVDLSPKRQSLFVVVCKSIEKLAIGENRRWPQSVVYSQ